MVGGEYCKGNSGKALMILVGCKGEIAAFQKKEELGLKT